MVINMEYNHTPVLYNEALESLNIFPDGIYADLTAGGGGHSYGLLGRLKNGLLILSDRDPDSIEILNARFGDDPRVKIVKALYGEFSAVLASLGIEGVDGILVDCGVSSFQLDNAARGFSYIRQGPADMRMSKEGVSAADILNSADERELADIFFRFGEEKYSRSVAKNIVKAREQKPIETTFELVEIIKRSMPQKVVRGANSAKVSKKVFQALRIKVNDEITSLPESIDSMFGCLNKNGVLSMLSFHSIEDRIIKTKFNELCTGCTCPPEFPICTCHKQPRARMQFKFISPSEAEERENPRSRSAKLRSIIRN